MTRTWKRLILVVLAGPVSLASDCTREVRDAVIQAGFDYANLVADGALADLLPFDDFFIDEE